MSALIRSERGEYRALRSEKDKTCSKHKKLAQEEEIKDEDRKNCFHLYFEEILVAGVGSTKASHGIHNWVNDIHLHISFGSSIVRAYVSTRTEA